VPRKRIVRLATADEDVDRIIDHYLAEGGADVAMAFVDKLEAALEHLSLHPGTGSRRYGDELGLEGLRSWPIGRFPYLVFYFEKADVVELWRVLHEMLDIPSWLTP
jgi:toxin ParE1/3/4